MRYASVRRKYSGCILQAWLLLAVAQQAGCCVFRASAWFVVLRVVLFGQVQQGAASCITAAAILRLATPPCYAIALCMVLVSWLFICQQC
jgi:hypothetical protein